MKWSLLFPTDKQYWNRFIVVIKQKQKHTPQKWKEYKFVFKFSALFIHVDSCVTNNFMNITLIILWALTIFRMLA